MNLRLRLIISHLAMFFMPIFTIFIIAVIFLGSAMFLIRGQNHLHMETMSKCSYAAEITSHILLHGDVDSPKNDASEWLISILSPEQNLVVLSPGDRFPCIFTATAATFRKSSLSPMTASGRIPGAPAMDSICIR